MTVEYVITMILCTLIKVLLIPTYRSTDFEVHRNWLAITSSRKMDSWYFENTSEWTLDYPPFFAYFEYILAFLSKFFVNDPQMLVISQTPYVSPSVIYYQRESVMITDIVLLLSSYRLLNSIYASNNLTDSSILQSKKICSFILIAFNCGLYLVDHIHFQVLV